MISRFRNGLPQLKGGLFLTDAGLETDFIFNKGIDVPEFAAHTLLPDPETRAMVEDYFRAFLDLARVCHAGFILDSQTWKAQARWASCLGDNEANLLAANRDSMALISSLRAEFADNPKPVILNGVVGPCTDSYSQVPTMTAHQSEIYHAAQISCLAKNGADMVTATSFAQSEEAIGFVRAAMAIGIPAVISFSLETDGRLPPGQPLDEAIDEVDAATDNGPAYYMVNCAHPDHFFNVLTVSPWASRIRGLRCHASRRDHVDLYCSDTLDDGDPDELADQYRTIREKMPWLNVFGGCCGTDLRHVTAIVRAIAA